MGSWKRTSLITVLAGALVATAIGATLGYRAAKAPQEVQLTKQVAWNVDSKNPVQEVASFQKMASDVGNTSTELGKAGDGTEYFALDVRMGNDDNDKPVVQLILSAPGMKLAGWISPLSNDLFVMNGNTPTFIPPATSDNPDPSTPDRHVVDATPSPSVAGSGQFDIGAVVNQFINAISTLTQGTPASTQAGMASLFDAIATLIQTVVNGIDNLIGAATGNGGN